MRRDDFTLFDPPANDRPSDRWMCGHAADQPPCARGPSIKGRCPLADACRPKATWHGRRKRIMVSLLTVAAIVMLIAMQSGTAPTVFKPGELSTPHAQILSGTLASDRCATCHPGAATSATKFFNPSTVEHAGVSQSDRCLDCHHITMERQTAKMAHNIPLSMRSALRVASAAHPNDSSWHDLLPRAAVDQENVECSVCHQEHQGPDGDLLTIADTKCQACHRDRFGSFATSHPDWDQWPYGRGGEIAFNHTTHATKHYPATPRGGGVAAFQCSDCHTRNANNELVRSTSYEIACRNCHDQSLKLESAEGVTLLALPTLPAKAAEKIQPWPEAATGFYDGKLAPVAELLMRADPQTAASIRRLADKDFAQIDPNNSQAFTAGNQIATAHRELLLEIADQGQDVIMQRTTALGIAPATLVPFVRSLSPQLLEDAYRRWFSENDRGILEQASRQRDIFDFGVRRVDFQDITETPPSLLLTVAADDDLLIDDSDDLLGDTSDDLLGDTSDDLLGGDLLDGDPLGVDPLSVDLGNAPASSDRHRFNAQKMLPRGGWYIDELQLAIRYRGSGHADPVLKSTVDLISQLPPGDPVRKRLLASPAISACASCHRTAVNSLGSWRSEPLIGRSGGFTKFKHAPHLNVGQLADCTHCHQISGQSNDHSRLTNAPIEISDFSAMGRQSCAACHTPHAAGDACVKCHQYHIERHPRRAASAALLEKPADLR